MPPALLTARRGTAGAAAAAAQALHPPTSLACFLHRRLATLCRAAASTGRPRVPRPSTPAPRLRGARCARLACCTPPIQTSALTRIIRPSTYIAAQRSRRRQAATRAQASRGGGGGAVAAASAAAPAVSADHLLAPSLPQRRATARLPRASTTQPKTCCSCRTAPSIRTRAGAGGCLVRNAVHASAGLGTACCGKACTLVLNLAIPPACPAPHSGSPSNGTVPRCVLFRDTGERRSVACAGQERTCFAKTMSGGWVFDKRCSATEPNVALRTTAQCQGDCGDALHACRRSPPRWLARCACALATHEPQTLMPVQVTAPRCPTTAIASTAPSKLTA